MEKLSKCLTATNMNVEVLGILIPTQVRQNPCRPLFVFNLFRNLPNNFEHFTNYHVISPLSIGKGRNMFFRNNDNVYGPKWAGVMISKHVIAFVFLLERGCILQCNLAIKIISCVFHVVRDNTSLVDRTGLEPVASSMPSKRSTS